MNQVDTIINCRWLIPIEPDNVVYNDYAIIIHQGKIKDILPQKQAANHYQSSTTLNLTSHAVLPGFVNAHTHSPMTLFRGLADDLPLMEWLQNHIWPAESKWLSDEFIEDGTEIAIAEMIKCGTTCFNEHFFFPEVIAKVAARAKIRACIGPTLINFPTNWSQDENDGFERFTRLYKEHGNQGLITWSLAPHAPYTITDNLLKKVRDFSQHHDLPIHMHVHETANEIQESLEKYGKRPLKRLHDFELLSSRFQGVHMTQMNDEDLELLTLSKANVTHCPESNLKLASGYCEVERLLNNDVNVALGTDGAASNNDLDMMGEMRTAAFIGKTIANDATAVSATQVLRMATLNGAKSLGLEKEIGSLEVGKSADIIAIDLMHINTMPIYNPISQIVYSASNRQVTDVWVAGLQLLKNSKLLTMDEDNLFEKGKKWQKRIGSQ
ncbi:MAG: TRZ/ATZ family hydrolase [Gammaproteobacteria bacterium]|nr:TRZ/ATZ family hydrolase [Gammaproteobacteria bacterium]